MVLGGTGVGNFGEDRDRGTYLGVSTSCSAENPSNETVTETWLLKHGLAVL